ncbi:hypothetical protein [Desulfoglaeba alkanexedens]|uniref:Uncharacterized protein n=1 Tax=Desulfoglaeba alkanexedens ALDC TaxID=980445 RepID=A0A4P8L4V0_9BACT|nr:hypothetical protein [Desulfoglaeba alkanexedens]QCQ22075.1 hypothetical protein FDQ92_07775 [Desulfoglaeba alkanexedens ALDC]
MGFNICSIQEKRLVDRFHSLKVKGEIIEKRRLQPSGGQPERKVVMIRFKDREIEKQLDDAQFERTQIGEQIWFSPPLPDRDPCNCHLFVCLIGAIIAAALAIWAITSHFHGRTATLLSLAAAGWVSVIVWAKICCHEQNRCLRDLEQDLRFFETNEYKMGSQV